MLTIDNSAVFLNNGTVAFSNDADLATTLGGTFQNDGTLEVTNFAALNISADITFNGGPASPLSHHRRQRCFPFYKRTTLAARDH